MTPLGDGTPARPSSVALFSACLPGWSAERVCKVATSLGFTEVEWGIGPGQAVGDPKDGNRIDAMCAAAGLSSTGVSVQDPEVTLGAAGTAGVYVRLAIALGAPQIRFFAAPYRGGRLATLQRRHRRAFDRLVELAAPAGVKVIIETSPDTLAPTPELAVALVGHHSPDRAGVLYDPGNMIIEGSLAPPLSIELLGSYLTHVHVKNIAWSRRNGFWGWRYATLRDGMLDWPDILRRLRSGDYGGRFSIDHLGGRPTAGLLQRESNHLREMVAAAQAGPR
jgi:sugar phosphate isomerase/epimerase